MPTVRTAPAYRLSIKSPSLANADKLARWMETVDGLRVERVPDAPTKFALVGPAPVLVYVLEEARLAFSITDQSLALAAMDLLHKLVPARAV